MFTVLDLTFVHYEIIIMLY